MVHKYYVYKLTIIDKNNKFYIGSTGNLKQRKQRHLKDLINGRHANIYLQKAFNGINKDESLVKFEILYEFDNVEDAHLKEEELIIKTYEYNYNISKCAHGGDNISYHPENERIRQLQSKLGKERYSKMTEDERHRLSLSLTGEGNPNYKTGKYSKSYLNKVKSDNINKYKKLGLKNIHSLSRFNKEPWNKLSNQKIIERRSIIGDSVIYCEGYLFPNLMYAEYIYDVDLSARILSNKVASSEFRIATNNDLITYPYYDIEKHNIVKRGREEGSYLRTVMVVWRDILFKSISDMAKAFNISGTGVMLRIESKSEKFKDYRYATKEDIDKLNVYNSLKDSSIINLEIDRLVNTKKVSCLGVVYNSVKEASVALNIKPTTLSWRLRSDKEYFKDYFYITKQNV